MNAVVRAALALTLILPLALPASRLAHAQDDAPAPGYPPSEPVQVPRWAHPEPEPSAGPAGPVRSGFTLLLALGVGYQKNDPEVVEDEIDQIAFSGLNVGIGGFLTNDLALLFRASGTVAFLDEGPFDSVTSTSGVAAFAAQYWPLAPLRLEFGVGLGFHSYEIEVDDLTIRRDESGFGLIAAVAAAFWQTEGHALLLGIDYAPAFVEDGPVHNVGFNFGWQLL